MNVRVPRRRFILFWELRGVVAQVDWGDQQDVWVTLIFGELDLGARDAASALFGRPNSNAPHPRFSRPYDQ